MKHSLLFLSPLRAKLQFLAKLTLLVTLVFNISLFAQEKGQITGVVVDGDLGESMIGANVFIDGTNYGGATDIEGRYTISGVPAGNYTLIFSMIGYAKKTVTDVVVKPGENTKVDMVLSMETIETEEVVVTAKSLQDSEAGLLIKRQKSTTVSDAISAEQISRSGGGNAAEAVKQIVGASVVDGKQVYVRGLGDRYTSTQLNGAEIPSVDPYKRSGSIDLIPSSLVENIQAVKSFTPDKPGDFSGGAVDIKTKDFPEKFNLNFSASTTYNSNATFNDDFIGVYSSKTDYLGYDDGSRDIPSEIGALLEIDAGAAVKNDTLARHIDQTTKAFNSDFGVFNEAPPLNQSYSLSIGNQVDFLGKPFGFIASISYKNNFSGYSNGEYNRWDRGVADPNKTQLETILDFNEQYTSHEVLWGTVLKGSYKLTPEHILSANILINQNGENAASFLSGSYPYDTDSKNTWQAITHHYTERSLKSYQLSGQHYFNGLADLKMDWKANYMLSNQDEPDLRYFYRIITPDSNYIVKSNLNPERYFRYTDENQQGGELNFSLPFDFLSNKQSTFKFGGSYSNKEREFRERGFAYQPKTKLSGALRQVNGDIESFFSDEILGWTGQDTITFGGNTSINNEIGVYVEESVRDASNYDGEREISAFYGMFDVPFSVKSVGEFRVITGARYESTLMNVVNFLDSTANIDTRDLLPSLSLVYSPMPSMNVRASYGKTLARPTFREISPFENFEFNGGNSFRGNTNLDRTLIDNYDLRWEWYTGSGEILAVSGFYKIFKDPIVTKITDAVNLLYSWENVPEATVYGVEFEVRERLDILHESLRNFLIGANVSFINSKVDIDQAELERIKVYEPDASSTRQFQGQSPYIINANINYDDYENGFSASLYYNVFGRRLTAVGSAGAPDVFEEPFHLLNMSISKSLIYNLTLDVAVNNILNSKETKLQEFKGEEYIYTSHNNGTSVTFGLKYSL